MQLQYSHVLEEMLQFLHIFILETVDGYLGQETWLKTDAQEV